MFPVLFSMWLSTAALAQEAPADPPSEVPAESSEEAEEPQETTDEALDSLPPPPVQPGPARRRGKRAPPSAAMTPERLRALRAYKNQSLSIRRETDIHGGGYGYQSAVRVGYGMGPLVVTQTVQPNPIYTTRSWGIYRGPERISVPRFHQIVGDTTRLEALQADIQHYQQRSKRAFTVAGIGGAGVFLGVMGMSVATTPSAWRSWNMITLGSSLTALGGMISGSLPASQATQLTRHPRTSMTPEEAQEAIDRYNEALGRELGLSPQEIWALEVRER